MNEHAKHAIDGLSIVTVFATIAQWLPAAAAAASLVWTAIRIWETKTVQGMVKKWRGRR